MLTKVMKYELRYLDGCGDFSQMQHCVWELQKLTRTILNQSIQILYHWDYLDENAFKETGNHLDCVAETGYKRLDGYVYNCLKDQCGDMASSNLNATVQQAWNKYKSSKKDIQKGLMSLPSYKREQPLLIHNKSIRLYQEAESTIAELALFSKNFKKDHALSSNVRFALLVRDNTQRSIIERILSKEYSIGQCQLVYDRPKWFLFLTYNFEPHSSKVDPEKILGVDLGESYALYASAYGEYGALRIEGGEITAFAKKTEARKHSQQKQAAICGKGRIGHGSKNKSGRCVQNGK